MTPVGLDLSLTATGIATDRLLTIKTLAVMKMGARLDKILNGINDAAVSIDDPFFIVENFPFTRNNSAGQLGMVHGIVHLYSHQCSIPLLTVPPSTLKKFGTGKGNATKPDMRMALFKRMDLDVKDDNQVDAWWLRALGFFLLGRPIIELPKTHTDHLLKLQDGFLEATSA